MESVVSRENIADTTQALKKLRQYPLKITRLTWRLHRGRTCNLP